MSASSGIGTSPEVISSYQDMKNLKNCASLILHIECDEVRIKSKGDPLPENCTEDENKERFEKLKAGLKHNESRFIVFDFWVPDNAPMGEKLIFSSTKDDFRHKLEGIHADQQANKMGDLDYESLKRKLERT